jgi:putative nucleotidyltransferase with HDIG domain
MKDTKNGKQKDTKSLYREVIDRHGRMFLLICPAAAVVAASLMVDLNPARLSGGFLISLVLLFILYRDILRYKSSYLEGRTLLLLGLMIVGTLLTARSFEFLLVNLSRGLGFIPVDTAVFGIPIAAGAMLMTLLFDFHLAITFSFTISILMGYWLRDPYMTFYAFVGSLTAAFSVIRCKKRSALLRGGLFVMIANLLMALIILIDRGLLISDKSMPSLVFALFSGLSVSAMVSFILPFLEYAFKITTDISLLELLDLNQPLMKNLMITAPGTYHHSVIVGNLVESAAEAVGVNPLLGRVSSYYHDIGKVKMPDYFVENQGGSPSKHDRLTPHMSSMIITSHVKEGVELARQFKLPPVIVDIIKQHHGDSVITYFYQRARESETVDGTREQDYKYPGPKPQTRVSALVMMADAVEAASRVLNDPTPARISALVDKIINHLILEGQLDECELTLKNISEIKKRFSYILTGIFHKRIDYPGFDFGDDNRPKEQPKGEKPKQGEDTKGVAQGTQPARVPGG